MKAECYLLYLYCDAKGDIDHNAPHDFTGENQKECYLQARGLGWTLGKKDICPSCSKKRSSSQLDKRGKV